MARLQMERVAQVQARLDVDNAKALDEERAKVG
jgi:hypothetical protein